MKRVLILGSGSAGKTTFAQALAGATGLPLVHLDSLHWGPGWNSVAPQVFQKRLASALKRPAWIIDGSYLASLPQRLKRADTVIYLDYSRWRCLAQLLKRRLAYRSSTGKIRPGMPDGCPERIYFSYVRWLWRYPISERPKVFAAIDQCKHKVNVLRFSDPGAADGFLCTLIHKK
jgi:adenylate kinase family enzyme